MKCIAVIATILCFSLNLKAQDDEIYYGLSYYLCHKVNYDMTLFRERKGKFVPDYLKKFIRSDAITYYPWPYSPSCGLSKKTDFMAPACLLGRDNETYYFILSLRDRKAFPNADISESPFANILYEDGSVLSLQLDSITPLIESLWYLINGSGGQFGYAAITDDIELYNSSNPIIYNDAQNYWLSQYRLDIVFRANDIEKLLNCKPVKFNFLGGQYIFDLSDNPKVQKRLYKNLKQSRKRLDQAYRYYELYMQRHHTLQSR